MAFLIIVLVWLSRRPPLERIVVPAHFHDLGNLMLAFVMLWAYFSFSQYLIIWSGNLPRRDHLVHCTGCRPAGGSSAWCWSCSTSRCRSSCCCRGRSSASRRLLVKVAVGILVVRARRSVLADRAGVPPERLSVSWLDVVLPLTLGVDLARLLHLAAARPRDSADPRSGVRRSARPTSSSAAASARGRRIEAAP